MYSGTSYLNDGDAEKADDHDADNKSPTHEDGDGDSSEEYEETYDNRSYHDSDDGDILKYGHEANAAEAHALGIEVKRYYAAAAAGDGAMACAAMLRSMAEALPDEYGQGPGPAYLHGGRSCATVMSLLFKHDHEQLSGGVSVTGMRLDGREARVLLGSHTLPAGEIALRSERGAWKIAALLGQPLP